MNEPQFDAAREAMVADQLEARGITDPRVLEAMRRIPRHLFVPPELRDKAYEDGPLAIGEGQTISQPYMVALMTQLLRLRPTDRVLEVGTGSGYQTAVLAALASEVVSIERHETLARAAAFTLKTLGLTNIVLLSGDGTLGYPARAPYDAILVTAGGPQTPPSLQDQLAMGGRLVCPVGSRKAQRIVRYVRAPDRLWQEESVACVFVPLIGEEGWHDEGSSDNGR